MSMVPDVPGDSPVEPPSVAAATRRAISEDWAATIVGLALLFLVLAGIITGEMIP